MRGEKCTDFHSQNLKERDNPGDQCSDDTIVLNEI
jgi:hypothetical protein